MAITIEGFHHAGLLVTDLPKAIQFYEGVLGLSPLPRPDLGFAGGWYDLGNGQQIHLMVVPTVPGHHDPPRHDRHLALTVASLDETEAELRRQGVEITYGSGRSGRPQLFVRDPDGNTIELRSKR
jgi:glyoxylase I family protein